MDETQIYLENRRIFESGIASGVTKSPYRLTKEELNDLEGTISAYDLVGEPVVLVEWGQPFGGPLSARKYHPQSDIQRLQDMYRMHNLKGICPKAGLVVDLNWIAEQKERLARQTPTTSSGTNVEEYLEFARSTHF